MDTINSKQKNSLIVFVVLILFILGAFYFKSNKIAESPVVETEDVLNSDETGALPVQEDVENSTNSETLVNNGTVSSTTDKEEEKKFSTAMTNGSDAFLAKNYDQAIKYYKEALNYKDSDVVYIRLFSVYNVQNNIDQARLAIEKAIKLNPSYTDYWVTKLIFLDEKTSISFADLKKIYTEALARVDSRTKINLVTSFARIAETNKEIPEAINLWTYAKEVYPSASATFQQEIDRLKI